MRLPPPEIHTPLTAKQPVLPDAVRRFIPPPWKVEVAVVEAKKPVVPEMARRVEGVVVPMPTEPELARKREEVASERFVDPPRKM